MNESAYKDAFFALQRQLLVIDPAFGEGRWQWDHAFLRLPAQQQSAGHWYRGDKGGFIHVDENLNGEYVKQLPPGVDPATVVDLPLGSYPTILDTMAGLLPPMEQGSRARFEATLKNLKATAGAGYPREVVRQFQVSLFETVLRSPKEAVDLIQKAANFHKGEGMVEGKSYGEAAAAFLLIEALARGVAEAGQEGLHVLRMLPSPGVASPEGLAGQMVRDCIRHGFSGLVDKTLAELSKEGNGMVDAAREGMYPLGHPAMMLPMYYFGLFGAAPYLRAVMIGYEVAAMNPELSEQERRLYATRANAAEEKLARVCDAVVFSVKDLDGSEARSRRAAVQALLASGEQDKADAMVMEIVDLHLFLPKPFRQYLLRPEVGA